MNNYSESLSKLKHVLTGTISKRYGPCGKTTCHCCKGKKYWHGPYFVWTRKVNGKTITKSLSPKQAEFCKKAIANSKKLNALIDQWRNDSLLTLVEMTVRKRTS